MKYYSFTLSQKRVRVRVSVLDASFNDISVILWQSVLALDETGVPRENHGLDASHGQNLSHYVISSVSERNSNSQH